MEQDEDGLGARAGYEAANCPADSGITGCVIVKRTVFLAVSALLLFSLAGCSLAENGNEGSKEPYYGAMSVHVFETFRDLEEDSALIILAEKTGNSMIREQDILRFVITEVKVAKVLKGDPSLFGQTVNILEYAPMSMTTHDKEKRYVLFLYPHDGKIVDNGYWITGVYQGKFKLDQNGKLLYDAHQYGGVITFQDQLTGLAVSELESRLGRH
jgi:hypothetical protein